MPDGGTAWWDGYQWLQHPPQAPPLPYRTVSVVGALAQAALAAVAAASLLLVWAHLRRRQAASDFGASLDFASAKSLDDATAVVGLISLGYFAAFLASAVLVPVLCNRIHHNLEAPMGVRGLEYSAGWAAGWWFVPLANFVMPFRVVTEAWRASDPSLARGSMGWKAARVPAVMGFWWACFVVSGIISRFSFTTTDATGRVTPGSVETSSTIAMLGAASGAVGAVLAVAVFRQLTQRHLARARALGIADG